MADQSEIDELRAELVALRKEVALLRRDRGPGGSASAPTGDRAGRDHPRRELLKLTGAAIAAGTAGALASSSSAAAADPDIAFGQIKEYTGPQTTARRIPAAAPGDHGFMFQVGGTDAGFSSNYPSALAGWSAANDRPHGVVGRSNALGGTGVIGIGGGFGVGVRAEGSERGVDAESSKIGVNARGNVIGVWGSSLDVGLLATGDRVPLRLQANGTTSPPARTKLHQAGDVVVATSGVSPRT